MQKHLEQTLYKPHSTGQVGSWSIKVEGDHSAALMTREACKVLGGTPVITQTEFTEGKNIGRSNETTALEQALSEARSKISKQLDKGYTVEIPDAGAAATNALGYLKPMLAQPIEKVKDWGFPVYVQPKLDGHRMLATVQNGQVILYSRQGKIINVEHIRAKLQKMYDDDLWAGETLDGEVYCHGLTLQAISSLVKKPQPESAKLSYNLYDIMIRDEYSERHEVLEYLTFKAGHDEITKVRTHYVESDEELTRLHAEFLSDGYEGTIVRHSSVGYESDKRSKSLMKKKDFDDNEFRIIGWKLGKPDIRPEFTYQRPVFLCRVGEDKVVEATAHGTMQERHAMYDKGLDTFIGKQLTIKHFGFTPDGIPFLPVALRFRENI